MSYQKLFQVSPKRKLGMLEGVLPTNNNEIYTPSLNYPIQGPGITCSKPYVGYEGDFEMTIGGWKNSENGWARPDAFAYNPSQFAPTPTGNCGTGMCKDICTPENVGDAYSQHLFLPDQPKNVQLGMKNYYVEQYGNNAVKDLDIVMYYSNGCGFCTQAKKMLTQAGVADFVTFQNSREHPLPKGVNGVPHFVSKKTGKSKTGAPRSVEDLVSVLSVQENFGNNAVKDLDIVMYYSNGCGFCTQAKKMLKQAGVADFVTFQNSREHPLPKGVNGVPHFVSKKTGKSKTGAPRSVEDLVSVLSVQENFGNYYEFKNYTEPGVEAVASIAGSRVADQYPCGDTNTCLTGKCPLKNPSKYVGIMGV